jgi:hypothetical protein
MSVAAHPQQNAESGDKFGKIKLWVKTVGQNGEPKASRWAN